MTDLKKLIPTKKVCVYCDEFPAAEVIINPNFDDEENPTWDVCVTCKKLIKSQQKLSLGHVLKCVEKKHPELKESHADKIIKEAEEEINSISHEAGLDVACVIIKRKEDNDDREEDD